MLIVRKRIVCTIKSTLMKYIQYKESDAFEYCNNIKNRIAFSYMDNSMIYNWYFTVWIIRLAKIDST